MMIGCLIEELKLAQERSPLGEDTPVFLCADGRYDSISCVDIDDHGDAIICN